MFGKGGLETKCVSTEQTGSVLAECSGVFESQPGAEDRLRAGLCGQNVRYGVFITQLVPSWARPRLTSRFRLMAAARTVSQMRFFSLPR